MIPLKYRKIIEADPYFKKCARQVGCSGRITIEHALLYAGKQINEMFNYVPLCWYHHLGQGLDKQFNQWVAIKRMTKEDKARYPRENWNQKLRYLNTLYEAYIPKF